MTPFWLGFQKRAEVLATVSDPETDERTPPPILERTVSKAGPRLSDKTEEMDAENSVRSRSTI